MVGNRENLERRIQLIIFHVEQLFGLGLQLNLERPDDLEFVFQIAPFGTLVRRDVEGDGGAGGVHPQQPLTQGTLLWQEHVAVVDGGKRRGRGWWCRSATTTHSRYTLVARARGGCGWWEETCKGMVALVGSARNNLTHGTLV